ncbi:uncharacterized protein LOC134196730 [Corticium candelabrum]|uniref:uncharacterized protein LOC134196730 n=1 Tax=Corticium candelabrum TaxID=121492 RepID=UPI002E25F45D|nr:uncharacterized protein LOC134196730 [Corticium candelabrum]
MNMPVALPAFWKVAAVVGLVVGKKAGIYALGRAYGYPRVYRRILEYSKMSIRDQNRRKGLQRSVKYVFRLPNRSLGPLIWGQKYQSRGL